MWHVSSRSGVATLTATHLLLTYLLQQGNQTHSWCHVTAQTRADWSASSSGCQTPFSSVLSLPVPAAHAPHTDCKHTPLQTTTTL